MVSLNGRTVILLVNVLPLVICEQNTISANISEKEDATKCTENIVRKYYSCETLMTLINPNANTDQLISSMTSNNCYTLILKSFKRHEWIISTDVYIIIVEDYLELSHGMSKLSQDVMWNPRADFIVLLENFNDTSQYLEDFFDTFLFYKMYQVVLIKDEVNGTMLYTYQPFADDNCGVDYETRDDLVHLGNCNDLDTINCFPDPDSKNAYNCRLRVVASEDIPNFIFDTNKFIKRGKYIQGLEQYLLETFEEREHIFIDYVIVPEDLRFGVVLPNGTATGLLSCLQNNVADIAAGGFILMKNRIDLFDYIWGYNYAAFNVFTPAFGKDAWEDVYKEFSSLTWILIFASYCSVTITSNLLSRKQYSSTYLMLRIWGYMFGNTNSKFSRQKGMKIIMIFWILFTFFICSFYNTALYSLITRFEQTSGIISDEELSNLPFKPCISEVTRTYFLFAFNQTLPENINYSECKYTESSLDLIASRKDLYGIEMEYIYTINENKYIDDVGNDKLDTWLFSFNHVISLYVSRGFAFRDELQRYARQMYETGLLIYQLDKISLSLGPPVNPYIKRFKEVALVDLRIHFSILILGSLFATFVFIIEMYFGRNKNKQTIKSPRIKFTL